MASLPSFVTTGSLLRLDSDSRKLPSSSISTEKKLSYPRALEYNFDPIELDLQEALSRLKSGSEIGPSCYLPILRECINQKSFPGVQIIQGHITKMGYHHDVYVMAFLVNAYAKCGTMESTQKLFNNLPQRDIVAWTSLMNGHVKNSEPELAIEVFLEMLESGAYPSDITLGVSLAACGDLRAIELGKQIHGFMIKYQLAHSPGVGNSLSRFYVRCGRLGSAIAAFQQIEEKDVISWTAVISACADFGRIPTALGLLTQMLYDGVEPDKRTFASVLSMCCKMKSLGLGMQVHAWSVKIGHVSNQRVANSLLYLYLKCGELHEAEKLFNIMKNVELVTWNVMISGFAELMNFAKDDLSAYGIGTEVLRIFLKLKRSSSKLERFTFSSVLSVCSRIFALFEGQQIHAQTLKSGFLSNEIVGTALVNMYNKCGSVEDASKAFEDLEARTLILGTSMVSGFAHNGETHEALQLFKDLRASGVRPNAVTFVGVLSACSQAGMLEEALMYFKMLQNHEYRLQPITAHITCLIDAFVRVGKLEEAFDFVKNLDLQLNEQIWSSLLVGCRHLGNTELGIYAAKELLKLELEDVETYWVILATFITAGRSVDVGKVKEMLRQKKIKKPTDLSWISVKDQVHSFKPDDPLLDHSVGVRNLLDKLLEKAKNLGYQKVDDLEYFIDVEDEGGVYSSIAYHSEQLAAAYGLLNTVEAKAVRVTKSVGMCRNSHEFVKAVSSITGRKIIIQDSKWMHKFVDGRCSCGDYGCMF